MRFVFSRNRYNKTKTRLLKQQSLKAIAASSRPEGRAGIQLVCMETSQCHAEKNKKNNVNSSHKLKQTKHSRSSDHSTLEHRYRNRRDWIHCIVQYSTLHGRTCSTLGQYCSGAMNCLITSQQLLQLSYSTPV